MTTSSTATAVPTGWRGRMPRSPWARRATLVGIVAVVVATMAVLVATVDTVALRTAASTALDQPLRLVAVLVVYGLAFVVRAGVWRRVLPGLTGGHALAAIHLALGGNHVLPLRLGEPLRVLSVVRRAGADPAAATASTVMLRGLDVVALAMLALLAGGGLLWDLSPVGALVLVVGSLAVAITGIVWVARLRRHGPTVAWPGATGVVAIAAAWALEGVVVHQAAAWAGHPVGVDTAMAATLVAVAAQVAAVAPGGFGTYEAAGTAALVALGMPIGVAVAVVVTAHAVKTLYALVAGAIAVVVPAPGMVGRLRLPRQLPPRPAARHATGPIVLFLPAHDEEATVARVVARCPQRIDGHEVVCMVVDDGSTDRTGQRARAAGAQVVHHDPNRGLGAAVATGLATATARDAVAVAFCDADGEYDPAQLADLVRPILAGDADYVVGSRFTGQIERMLPHRRLGNNVLTAWTRWTARIDLTDGQSGYRALSPAAAAEARIAHDFNYAQVLTLDLLARGCRYHEVPIRYRFRTEGRSFIRLGRYLRRVVPAVHRVVNHHA